MHSEGKLEGQVGAGRGSHENLLVNSAEGDIGQPAQGDFTLGGKKAAQVLTLAAGGDN